MSGASSVSDTTVPQDLHLCEATPEFREALRRLNRDLVSIASMADEPGHQALCDRETAIAARDELDLARHLQDAVVSLRICLAADESVRTRETIKL